MQPNILRYCSAYPSQQIAHTNFFVEQVGIVLTIQLAFINFLSHGFKFIEHLFPSALLGMSAGSAVAILCSSAALVLADTKPSLRLLSKCLAGSTTVVATISLCAPELSKLGGLSFGLQRPQAICLLLLGIAIFLVQSRTSLRSHLADVIASALGFLLLIFVSDFLFAWTKVPRASAIGLPPLPFLVCLGLLTVVVILRRAQHGVFSVFLGNGIGGRVARLLAPIIILINLGREIGRARILDVQLVPARFATSILPSTAIMIGFALLILLCRLINGMQTEIESLTLRDELTGLYSYRGFNLFAEQAFLLSRRAGQAFGVLFVDMDNLKKINDHLGHSQGSACLIEVARILTATFRETDVIGRLGGDEFVVAGQFEIPAMAHAMERLRSSALQSRIPGVHVSLSLSMGYAVTKWGSDETMKTLLSRADKAMYKEKRAKKRTPSAAPADEAAVSNTEAEEIRQSVETRGSGQITVAI